jgi:hypothetical protein
MQALAGARMTGPLAGLHEREMVNTARLMRLACRRAQSAFTGANEGDKRSDRQTAALWDEFLAEYRSVWLARNRPGGLTDSTARFESIRAELAL